MELYKTIVCMVLWRKNTVSQLEKQIILVETNGYSAETNKTFLMILLPSKVLSVKSVPKNLF